MIMREFEFIRKTAENIFFVAHSQKNDKFRQKLVVFQLNPPLRVGEIVFDDEIQLRWMKFASTASGWI